MILALLACTGPELICGPGTREFAGQCLPTQDDEPVPEDSRPQDSPTDSPQDSPVDSDPQPPPALVYLLAGQSNMVGVGELSAFPPSLREPQQDVQIYWSGRPAWSPLQASSDYSSTWVTYAGPELGFGRAMADAQPERQVLLIKHADGGTALADWWYPGVDGEDLANAGQGYTRFIDTVGQAAYELDQQGIPYEFAGMIWMQGETDATNQAWAEAYQGNLERFVERVREDLDEPELPFVIGEIHCLDVCAYRDTVVAAQRAVAAGDEQVHSFDTLDLERFPDDVWHYAGIGQRVMGQRFAASLLGTELAPFPTAAVEITGSYTWSYYGAYTVGWSFTTSEDLFVTDLGVFDLGDDGLAHSTQVGIWDAATEELLIVEDLHGSQLGPTTWHGGFRFVGTEPTLLPAGDYVIGNVSVGWNPDYYVYEAQITDSAEVDWLAYRHVQGSVLSFPTTVGPEGQTVASWFGPNFLYVSAQP